MRGRGKNKTISTANVRKAHGFRELAEPNERAFNSLPDKMQQNLNEVLQCSLAGSLGQQPVIELQTDAQQAKMIAALSHLCKKNGWLYLSTSGKTFNNPQTLGIQIASRFNYLYGRHEDQWTPENKAFFASLFDRSLDPYQDIGLTGAFGNRNLELTKKEIAMTISYRQADFMKSLDEENKEIFDTYPKGILIAAPHLENWSIEVLRTWVGATKRTGMNDYPLVWLSLPQNEAKFRQEACRADEDSTMAYRSLKWN